jgi:hypothetical protein
MSPSPSLRPGSDNKPQIQTSPSPKSGISYVARIAELEAQLKRIKESGEISPGNLQNQIDGMAMLMLEVSRKLKMPDDWHLRDLPEWIDCLGISVPIQQPPPPPAQA